MTAKDFGIAVNLFWKNLDDKLYDPKDPYGNKVRKRSVRPRLIARLNRSIYNPFQDTILFPGFDSRCQSPPDDGQRDQAAGSAPGGSGRFLRKTDRCSPGEEMSPQTRRLKPPAILVTDLTPIQITGIPSQVNQVILKLSFLHAFYV